MMLVKIVRITREAIILISTSKNDNRKTDLTTQQTLVCQWGSIFIKCLL